jgi:hypothetical protein
LIVSTDQLRKVAFYTPIREKSECAMARGRKPGFRMTDDHRAKIANSNILNALIEHVEGRREMSSSQVTAGVALLKKVMPDLSHNEHTGEDGGAIKLVIKTGVPRVGRD